MILISLFLTFLSKYSNITDARIADNRACYVVIIVRPQSMCFISKKHKVLLMGSILCRYSFLDMYQ